MKSQGRGKIVRRYQRGYVIILLSSLTPVTSYESPNYECMQDNLHTRRPGTVAQYGNTILCCFPVTSTGAPGSLSSDVFERRTLTGSGLFALLSRDFAHIFGQIVSIRVNTVINKNLVPSRHIIREKGSPPVDVHRSKTSLLKAPLPE